MKNLAYGSFNSRLLKLQQWSKVIAVTFSAQAIIQVLGLFTGVLIIRILPTKEYAFYTIANTMLGTMTILADGGISSGVMACGGRVWSDRTKLGAVLATGLKLRKKFAWISLMISLPVLAYLLSKHGADLVTTVLIIISITPSFLAALSDSLLEIPLKLHQSINKLQRNQLLTAIGRFVMIIPSLMLFPWTFITVLGNGIPRIWANNKLRKISVQYADTEQLTDPVIETEILNIVKRALPGAIYYCVSGQITIWLISIFGNTHAIAHIGALSRLSALVTIFTTLCNTLIIPRFSRIVSDRKLILKRFLQISGLLFGLSLVMVFFVASFPAQILRILGEDYSSLGREAVLITISSCLAMVLGVSYSLVLARGWILRPSVNIPINLLFQLGFVWMMDLSATSNVLMFSIADYTVSYVIVIVFFIYQIKNIKPVRVQ